MTKETRTKLERRLDHLKSVLEDSLQDDSALIALFHSVRDIQPGLCQALAEYSGDPEWALAYEDDVLSDADTIATGEFLWPEELEEDV